MDAKEVGSKFLARVCEYLVSLPFDLKILQEAVSDPDLERKARETAAGVLVHVLSRHEGAGPERYLEDVLLLRIALRRVAAEGGDGAAAFTGRFADVYGTLEDDLQLFERFLGRELWAWLFARSGSFGRLLWKGKRPDAYVDDQEALDDLYEDGLTFQTNYDLTDAQVGNKLRRPEPLLDLLTRRHAEDLKKRPI